MQYFDLKHLMKNIVERIEKIKTDPKLKVSIKLYYKICNHIYKNVILPFLQYQYYVCSLFYTYYSFYLNVYVTWFLCCLLMCKNICEKVCCCSFITPEITVAYDLKDCFPHSSQTGCSCILSYQIRHCGTARQVKVRLW